MRIPLPLSPGLLRLSSTPISRTRVTVSSSPDVASRFLNTAAMTQSGLASGLVEPAWLHANLENVTILDASWHMARENRNADAEYRLSRIPGARRFDIDAKGLSDVTAAYQHMLPRTAGEFGEAVRLLGVCESKPVVVYSKSGFFGAARAWWMFHLYGKPDVAVLDGGFSRWQEGGYPVVSGVSDGIVEVPDDDAFVPIFRPELVRNMTQMLSHIAVNDAVVLDVRSRGRFTGETPEPRQGVRSGHMPNALPLHYRECVDETTGKMKSKELLLDLFRKYGVSDGTLDDIQIVTTCGSGVSACVVALALHVAGQRDAAVYDGSWTEYGSHSENPVVTGP